MPLKILFNMNDAFGFFAILGFGLVAGIRHGFDLDHIAAIADITSSKTKTFLALLYSMLYGLGHAVVVIILGVILIMTSQSFPEGLDLIFGKIIGISLIGLGIYVLFSIFKYGKNFKLKSKWMLVFGFKEKKYAPQTALGIGMIHGIGAETPTQISAFLVLLGIGEEIKAIFFLLSFVLGIFISNILVAAFSVYGYKTVMKSQGIYIAIGLITAIFSIALGILFLIK